MILDGQPCEILYCDDILPSIVSLSSQVNFYLTNDNSLVPKKEEKEEGNLISGQIEDYVLFLVDVSFRSSGFGRRKNPSVIFSNLASTLLYPLVQLLLDSVALFGKINVHCFLYQYLGFDIWEGRAGCYFISSNGCSNKSL